MEASKRHLDRFFTALNIEADNLGDIRRFSDQTAIPVAVLRHYNEANIVPSGNDLASILKASGISEIELMLKMGIYDRRLTSLLQEHSDEIRNLLKNGGHQEHKRTTKRPSPVF